jgi:hypothetical protein
MSLAKHIYTCGKNGWPMPAHPHVRDADAQALYTEGFMAKCMEIDELVMDPELNREFVERIIR